MDLIRPGNYLQTSRQTLQKVLHAPVIYQSSREVVDEQSRKTTARNYTLRSECSIKSAAEKSLTKKEGDIQGLGRSEQCRDYAYYILEEAESVHESRVPTF